MSLVDDLKAAHEAATARYAPDEWPRRDAANYLLEELMRLHAAEIIAALEERERLREKIRVMSLYLRHNEWCAIYRNLHCTCGLDVQLAALDALEEKPGRPMIKSHPQMPAGNRTHALDALEEKDECE